MASPCLITTNQIRAEQWWPWPSLWSLSRLWQLYPLHSPKSLLWQNLLVIHTIICDTIKNVTWCLTRSLHLKMNNYIIWASGKYFKRYCVSLHLYYTFSDSSVRSTAVTLGVRWHCVASLLTYFYQLPCVYLGAKRRYINTLPFLFLFQYYR